MLGAAFKLVSDAPQRWLSLAKVLERILSLWPALRLHHHKSEQHEAFPLQDSEAILPQLFALVKPIANIIKESQAQSTWTAGKSLVDMSLLKVGVFNIAAALSVSAGI